MPSNRVGPAQDSRSASTRSLSLTARLPRFRRRCNARADGGVRVAQLIAVALVAIVVCERAAADSSNSRPLDAVQFDTQFAPFIDEAAKQLGIPAHWINAVMQAESSGDVHALSPTGAMGLMQIMPETWADLRLRYGLGADPYQPHDNILAGAAYLRELHDRYGVPGFLAAYNAGPARWEAHLAHGQALPNETRLYIAELLPVIGGDAVESVSASRAISISWTEAALFPVQTADKSITERMPARSQSATALAHDWTALAPQSAGLFVTVSHLAPVR